MIPHSSLFLKRGGSLPQAAELSDQFVLRFNGVIKSSLTCFADRITTEDDLSEKKSETEVERKAHVDSDYLCTVFWNICCCGVLLGGLCSFGW